MIIKELSILDIRMKTANVFSFSDKANIITSKNITVGKSSLLKTLYHTLGFSIKRFNNGWNKENIFSKIVYEHNGHQGYIIRNKNNFWVDGSHTALDLTKYSEWLMKLFDKSILLPVKQGKDNRTVYASVLLLPYYIDQDDSWGSIPYKSTTYDTGIYDFNSVPEKIFEHLFSISTDRITQKETELNSLADMRKEFSQKEKNLQDFKANFIQDNHNIYFNEEEIKSSIKKYLSYANNLSEKIQEFKNNIYSEQVILSALRVELSEVKEILYKTDNSYKNVKSECPTCGSFLTEEQTVKRMRLANDKLELSLFKAELEKKIERSENKIKSLLNETIGVEKEFEEITKIMDKKQGEFTLKQIIQEKAKEETKNIYVNIKLDLIERIRDLDNKIATIKNEISKMKEENKGKKDKILADFKIIMNRLSLKFGIDILNNIKFLEFKTIKTIGTSGKIVTLAVYLAYFELLCKYSSVELPFVLDSVIKEEPDDISMERMFSYIEDKLLKQNRQSFVSMLRDKLHYINGNYNIVDLTKPILNENKYDEVHKSIESLIAEIE